MSDKLKQEDGKIIMPYKFKDEENELDLTNEGDFTKAQRLIQQGFAYEKGQTELKVVKGDLDKAKNDLAYWGDLVNEAGTTKDNAKLEAALKLYNVEFNPQKSDDDDYVLDTGSKLIKELEKKYDEKFNMLEGAFYNKTTADQHSQLEAKYNDGRHPEYNRKEIEDFANKRGITHFEDAYDLKFKDELKKMDEKAKIDEKNKHKKKVDGAASIEPGSGELPPKPITAHKDYKETSKDWMKDPAITENLLNDEQ